jgi:hypothetical protein
MLGSRVQHPHFSTLADNSGGPMSGIRTNPAVPRICVNDAFWPEAASAIN